MLYLDNNASIRKKKMDEINCLNICDILHQTLVKKEEIKYLLHEKQVKRIYIGSYFCGNYFLSITENNIKELLSYFEKKIVINLVIPTFNQKNLHCGKEKIDLFLQSFTDKIDEITVNDYGMLAYINDKYSKPIFLGRLFMKDYRDPRYYAHFNQTITPKILSSYLEELKVKYRIKGVEFDPINSILNFSIAPFDIEISMHTPYCYNTMGQICELASIVKDIDNKFRPNDECTFACNDHFIQFYSDEKIQFVKLGRAVYFYNQATQIIGINSIRILYFPLRELKIMEEKD